ncbi:MAG: hypothetical protein HY927_15255 [Elusimicrobia bacterium]|nr:hypothetical protein [Elusimicrobiota bacterium]
MSLQEPASTVPATLRVCAALPGGPGASLFLFPGEAGRGVAFSQEESVRQSGLLAPLYEELISAVAARTSRRCGVPAAAGEVLARVAIVPVVCCFMDRLLRLERLMRGRDGARPAVLRCEYPEAPQGFEAYIGSAGASAGFNQALLGELAAIWDLPPAREGRSASPAPGRKAGPAPVNFNCARLEGNWLRRAANKLACAATRRLNRGIPTLGLAYAELAFRDAFFFVRLLRQMPGDWPLQAAAPDPAVRDDVLGGAVAERAAAVERVLAEAGVAQEHVRRRARDTLDRHLRRFYPASFLESAAENLAFCVRELGSQPHKTLLATGIGSMREAFMVAAARVLGFETIGCQHAGGYGYLDAFAEAAEMEYPLVHTYVTWGWTDRPEHPACKSTRFVPLPSPWLSERARFWPKALARLTPADERPYDLLLMTSKYRAFTKTPASAASTRLDTLPRFADMARGLVRDAAAAGVSILHKLANHDTTQHLKGTLEDLRRLGGAGYAQWERFDKGMTPDLLSQARFVLWDQPGTGFAECVAAGIPTLVLWPRFDTRESPEAAGAFRALEDAGIVHRETGSLLAQTLRWRSAPAAWLEEPAHRRAVAQFCRKFAWVDPDWAGKWRKFLLGIGDEP